MEPGIFDGQRSSHSPSRRLMSSHFDLNIPMFPTSGLAYGMPFQQTTHYSNPGTSQIPHPPGYSHYFDPLPSQSQDFGRSLNISHPQHLLRDHRSELSQPTSRRGIKVESMQQDTSVTRPQTFGDGDSQAAAGGSFGTDVDTLVRTIQTKTSSSNCNDTGHHNTNAQVEQKPEVDNHSNFNPDASHGLRKKYQCHVSSCSKCFFQKTHLEIHLRAHTGFKPFLCKEPGCNQRFSQLGNLKTHERRHTGERPYACETCGKRFAQRGNVRAHRIVHDHVKPFTCKLDDCGKNFTQLGNLKSHQNKFHTEAIRLLTLKFASIQEGDIVSDQERELWDYFSTLYKNSNKGIKGRGKARSISNVDEGTSSRAHHRRISTSSNNSGEIAGEAFQRGHQLHDRGGLNNNDIDVRARAADVRGNRI